LENVSETRSYTTCIHNNFANLIWRNWEIRLGDIKIPIDEMVKFLDFCPSHRPENFWERPPQIKTGLLLKCLRDIYPKHFPDLHLRFLEIGLGEKSHIGAIVKF